ncbi:MAG: hypothetical protein M0R68_15265, partial [Bacteroidetes bacterium]|nr:hypothetical protein [Bacteroidota bacterium]
DNEHVGSIYLSRHPEEFRIVEMHIPDEYRVGDLRLTIDEEPDYKLFSTVYEQLWNNQPLDLLEVVNWLRSNPEIVEMNRSVRHSAVNQQVSEQMKKWEAVQKTGVFQWKSE